MRLQRVALSTIGSLLLGHLPGVALGQIRITTVVEPSSQTDLQYTEPHLAANPHDPTRIAAASIAVTPGGEWGVRAFHSVDGGVSWSESELPPLGELHCFGDPWLVWGERQTVYLVCITRRPIPAKNDWDAALLFYRSDDGGEHWRTPLLVPDDEVRGSWDHPVARHAPNGDIVVAGTRSRVGPDGFGVIRYRPSRHRFDALRSYLPPEQTNDNFGAQVALSGRGVVFTYFTMQSPPRPMYAVRLSDGEEERIRLRTHITPWGFPMLGAGGAPLRLYAVWLEDDAEGGLRVFLMQSVDEGRSWSDPIEVDDDRTPAFRAIPQVAVSPEGIVVVAWYDTRHMQEPGTPQPCGDVYLRWLDRELDPLGPALRLTSNGRCPNQRDPAGARQRWRAGGDYLGLEVTRDGVAMVVWGEPGSVGHRVRFARVEPPTLR